MSHYFLFPQKDTTIFSKSDLRLRNSGKDEILEIEKSYEWDDTVSNNRVTSARTLIKFDLTDKFNSWSTNDLLARKFILNLKTVEAKEVPLRYDILAYPISQSWEMGVGRKYDDYTTTGASWKYRDAADTDGNLWLSGSSTTDSSGGGTWYETGSILDNTGSIVVSSSYVMSQSFNYEASDVKLDITKAVRAWYAGLIPNEGLILMHSGESDTHDYLQLRFFGMDTNTIYSPYVDIQVDDASYSTGSLSPLTSSNNVVVIKNVRKEYLQGSIVKFEVFGREKYPTKSFGSTSDYLVTKTLPSTTYYSVKDAESEETLIDFDEYSKVSCSSSGNFFTLDMSGLPQERYFKFRIKVVSNGTVEYYDDPQIFKISR
jgi:hypothetical protein